MVACASPAPSTIPRVVDGEVEPGPFVSPYAYHWYIRGEVDAAKRAYEGAAIAFEAVRASPTDDELVLAQLALAYELSGEHRQADKTLDEALRSSPKSAQVWLARGKIAQARGQTEAAFLAYRRARSLRGAWDEPPLAIARLLEAEGHTTRAQSVLETHLRGTPDSLRARRAHMRLAAMRGDVDAAATHSERVVLGAALSGKTPPKDIGRRLELARKHLEAGRPALAERLAQEAQHLPRGRYLLGAARFAQRHYASAAATFASVPYGSRDYDRAMVGLARALTALDQEAAALELVEHGRARDVRLKVASASLYDSLGEHSTAVATLSSDGGVEQLARARLLEHLGRQKEANAQYRSIDPGRVEDRAAHRRIRAERAVAQGRLDAAAEELRALRRLAPADLWARVRLVGVLELRGETGPAAHEREALQRVAYEDAMLRLLEQ